MERMIQVDIAVRKTVDIPLRWHLHPYLAHLFHQRISIITTQNDHLSCQGLVLRLVAFTDIPIGFNSRISSVGRALDSRAGSCGFDSLDQTNTKGLKITEK